MSPDPSSSRSSPAAPAAPGLIDAAAAAARLKVCRATLYAYVSRGQVRSAPAPGDPRRRLYAVADIEALLHRKQNLRRPAAAAATALDWGLPVLETRITRMAAGRLFYRGRDARLLAETESFEQVAALLWEAGASEPFAQARFRAAAVPGWSRTCHALKDAVPTDRALALIPLLHAIEPPRTSRAPSPAPLAATLVLALAEALVGRALAPGLALHRAVARAW